MRRGLTFALPLRGRGASLIIAVFAVGFALGAAFKALPMAPWSGGKIVAAAAARDDASGPMTSVQGYASYPAEVIRVIDGDTFEARVRVWPTLNVETRVRLRNIDAPELHARCADEFARARAARTALQAMLAAGGVTLSQVGLDKFGGRVDAIVATRDVADVSAALLRGGFARSYGGGRRASWC